MQKKLRIAVIFGGRSGEHEVSLVSAASVMKALNPKKYKIIPIGITKTGKWMSGENTLEALKTGKTKKALNKLPAELQNIDVAFPVLHGPFGEDGTIQGLLEIADIPYVGCDVLASAIAMDKYISKIIFKAYGLPQVKFLRANRNEIKKELPKIKKLIKKQIGFPCFVKPANLGSSVGISKAKNEKQLVAALNNAASYDSSIIIEKAVDAREIECAVLGNTHPVASVAGEIIPNREFYDYFSKYVDGKARLVIPAKLSTKKMREVQKLAVQAFRALECRGMGRVDFLMDKKTGKLYLSEVNTIPGFTGISMYPKLWAISGISYPRLIDRLIKLALERHREKKKNKISFDSGSDWYKE